MPEPPAPTVTVFDSPAGIDTEDAYTRPPAPPPPALPEEPPPPPATIKISAEIVCGVSKVTSSSTVGIQPCVAPEYTILTC